MCHQPFSLSFNFFGICWWRFAPTLTHQSTNVSYYSVINQGLDYRLNKIGGWMISITKSFYSLFMLINKFQKLIPKTKDAGPPRFDSKPMKEWQSLKNSCIKMTPLNNENKPNVLFMGPFIIIHLATPE